jgi:hypothetical protein
MCTAKTDLKYRIVAIEISAGPGLTGQPHISFLVKCCGKPQQYELLRTYTIGQILALV